MKANQEEMNSNFSYVLVAARRARQLQNGSNPLVESRSTKACRVAQDEIKAGKVNYTYKERTPAVVENVADNEPDSDY